MAELRAPRRLDSAVGARGPEASSNDELNVVAASTAVRARSTTGGTPGTARHGNRVARSGPTAVVRDAVPVAPLLLPPSDSWRGKDKGWRENTEKYTASLLDARFALRVV
jgi:hypothetical protein